MYKTEIDLVNSVMSGSGVWSHKQTAWYKLKAFIEEHAKDNLVKLPTPEQLYEKVRTRVTYEDVEVILKLLKTGDF